MNALHRRLDRFAKFLPPLPTCRICMYPRPESKGYIITNHRDPMKQCEGCGRYLDDHGVPMHQPYKRTILMRGERQFTRDPEKLQ